MVPMLEYEIRWNMKSARNFDYLVGFLLNQVLIKGSEKLGAYANIYGN